MKRKIIAGVSVGVVLLAVLIAGIVAARALRSDGNGANPVNDEGGDKMIGEAANVVPSSTNENAQQVTVDGNKKHRVKLSRISNAELIDLRDDLLPDEKKLLHAIDDALEAEDFDALVAKAQEVSLSTNAEIRGDFVDALSWFGKKGMVEMLPFMADKDAGVAESARDSWVSSLSQISSESRKASYVEMAATILTDTDTLDDMMSELLDCDEVTAIQTIVNIIENGGTAEAVDTAKENYEFITGEEYTTVDAAELWLQENAVEDLSDDGDSPSASDKAETAAEQN